MAATALAFLWHQHQPYYPDDVTGDVRMPWVRLHGVKSYYGMALHLLEVPEFRCTINLVPSLLVQIQRYGNGGSDRALDVARTPADGLSESAALALLDQSFMANRDTMIGPYSRFVELYEKRGVGKLAAVEALPRFSVADLRDLQVLYNLAWIHPLVFEQDAGLRSLREKGRNFTEAEKAQVLDKHLEILQQIVPLHKQLADRGQVELTTTPFYHPILPLLWDKRLARQALPECPLPKHLDAYPGDIQTHLVRAVALHTEVFGAPPKGLWPSEGSVAQEIIPAIADAGIEWIATDEEVLSRSTNGWVSRDPQGYLRHPEMLYRPWRVEEQDRAVQVVFRDHGLSDLIGFHYQRTDPIRAAVDLLARTEAIGRTCASSGRPALVPVILDGENCWEHYPDGGVAFLRTLYQNTVRHSAIRPVRMSDALREHPATDRIGRLFAGSWISHSFAIWIGHAEDNAAWDLLHQTREFLVAAQAKGSHAPAVIERAWTEIYIAEGSDWFWWFGDDHNSAQDDLFDQLFRKHLANVYLLLGARVPAEVNRAIARLQKRALHTEPRGFLDVKVDGRRTYFEWINAAHYVAGNERGTMTLVTEGIVREIFFGFDARQLMLRIDTAHSAKDELQPVDMLRIGFNEPAGYEVQVLHPGRPEQSATLLHKGGPVGDARVEAVTDLIFELRVAFADLALKPGDAVQFFVELHGQGQSLDRTPHEGALTFQVPSAEFEQIMWQA